MKRRGNILIPTFAFHRTQEMAKRIDDAMENGALPHYNVYTISNLARKITGHFDANKNLFNENIQAQKHPFEHTHVKNIERTSEIEEPAIAICTPGFGHAGASLSLLADWAEGEENGIILTSGYLPPDSPLKQAREKKFFRWDGEKIDVYAHMEQIELSGHADQAELVELVKTLKPKKTLLVHGDLKQAEMLSEKIAGLTEVYIPEKNEVISA
jgi:Cft2 family RNA processing exonuclease